MEGPRILVLRQKIHGLDASAYADALEDRLPDVEITLATTPDEERSALETATVATGLELNEAALDSAANLELFACVFAGTSHLDLAAFEQRDIVVTNASGVHGPNVAEFVIGGMIQHTHQFETARQQQSDRRWQSYQTDELAGSTATIVGLGAIGEAIARRLAAFEMELVGVRYSPEKGGPVDEVYGFDELHEAIVDSQYVLLACPLTDETVGLIDADVFRTMESDALLVNVARGPVIDTEALVEAMRTNAIGGAVLDVTDPEPLPEEHPLWGFTNVFITPHNAGQTPAYFDRLSDIVAENISRLREGEKDDLQNRVI